MNMRRISNIWSQAPWRRKKDEGKQKKGENRLSNAVNASAKQTQNVPRNNEDDTTESILQNLNRRSRRITRIFALDAIIDLQDAPLIRRSSLQQKRRSFLKPAASPDEHRRDSGLEPDASDESFLRRMRRKSQNFTLPRPSTSSGITRRRSFFGGVADDDIDTPPVPAFLQPLNRRPQSRHIPITIDHLQSIDQMQSAELGPGMAITTNDVQERTRSFSEYPRSRPISSSNSFSHLRPWTTRTMLSASPMLEESPSDVSDDDEDVLTALPDIDFKEMAALELKNPASYNIAPKPPMDKHTMQRAKPKMVDILAPRPLSMFATHTQPKRPSTASTVTSTSTRDRIRSMLHSPTTSPIGPLEDGPKGDWARTRHSWLGAGDEPRSEQLEWDKLKQFIEAFGTNHDGAVVSMVRQMDDSGDSSSSDDAFRGKKFSNAQALAALEFGLNN